MPPDYEERVTAKIEALRRQQNEPNSVAYGGQSCPQPTS
jgi:hypothetical protein